MRKLGAIGALLLAGLLVSTTVAEESTSPPKNLKLVGDHWTPWDPPAAGPGAYIIQKDDTLWDLAEKWLGDPFLWPQIWDENRYVLESHWIYPGDPIVIPGAPTVVPPEGPPEGGEVAEGGEGAGEAGPESGGPQEAAPGAEGPAGPGEGEGADAGHPERPPMVPVAAPVDLYCTGYVDANHDPSDVSVAGRELEKIGLAQGDVIYINRGRDHGVQPGSEWAVIRPSYDVEHPVTEAKLGQYVRRLGKARILAVQPYTSMAVVEMACEDIHVNDEIVSWIDIPIPVMTMPSFDRLEVEPSGGATGYIVAVQDQLSAVGAGHVIHVDLGDGSGVEPGSVLSLFRENGGLPRTMLGQAVVLTVEFGTSTARITNSVRESEVGDRVEVQ